MKKMLLAAAMMAAGVVSVHAADLIVDEPVVAPEPAVTNIYAQVLGGVALPGVVTWDDTNEWDIDAGWGLGATLGVGLVEGLSAELDVLHLSRTLSDADYDVATTSLMANLKYTVDLNETFSLYGAAGLGYIWINETDNDLDLSFHESGFGYQLIAGVGAEVADNISLIGEYRFQSPFGSVENTDDNYTIEVATSALLVGAKIGF